MYKTDLAKKVSELTNIPANAVGDVLDAAIKAVKEELAEGRTVTLTNFGTFTPSLHKEREIVDLKGDRVTVPAHKTVSFRPGTGLKRAMNPPKRKRGRPRKNTK